MVSYDQGAGKNNGSVVQITNGRDSTRTTAYTYDHLNRLSTAQTPSAATWGNSYGYDQWGNLLQKNLIKGVAETMSLTVGTNNQVIIPAFTYDAAGNVTSDTSVSMTYDAEGRMNPTTGTTYTYDGDGRRVKKSDGTVYWVDDSFRPISIGTTSGSLTKDFIFMGRKRIAFVSLASGVPYFYLSDNLGSTAVISSGDGKSIQWEADYFPFGAQRHVYTSSINNSYQFTGYEYDSDTQYNYAVARFDAGRWGRFMSSDPDLNSIDVTKPQTLDRYSYVVGNPTNFNDPFGLDLNCQEVASGDSMYDGVFFTLHCVDTPPNSPSDDSGGGSGITGGGGFAGGTHQPLQSAGGAGGSGDSKRVRHFKCANKFANDHSAAALFGAQNTFVGKMLGGNVFGGIGELGVSIATSDFNLFSDGAMIMYGGASLGIPVPGNHPGLNGAGGLVQDSIVKGAAAFGYNVLTGGAELAPEVLEDIAGVAGLTKAGYDFLSYAYGYAVCR